MFELNFCQITGKSDAPLSSSVMVNIAVGNREVQNIASGGTLIEASLKAVNKALGLLDGFDCRYIFRGSSAEIVKTSFIIDELFEGQGESEDVIEAIVSAYLNALESVLEGIMYYPCSDSPHLEQERTGNKLRLWYNKPEDVTKGWWCLPNGLPCG